MTAEDGTPLIAAIDSPFAPQDFIARMDQGVPVLELRRDGESFLFRRAKGK